MNESLPDFTGKVVQFGIAGDDHSYAIENPRFEMQAGKLFVVGAVPQGGSSGDWSEGVVSALCWDQVAEYLVFDSAAHYQKRLKVYEKSKG